MLDKITFYQATCQNDLFSVYFNAVVRTEQRYQILIFVAFVANFWLRKCGNRQRKIQINKNTT
jgi:hypothetical protein